MEALFGRVCMDVVLSGHLGQRPHDEKVFEMPERTARECHGALHAQFGSQLLSEMRQRERKVGQPVHLIFEQTGLQDLVLQMRQDDNGPELAEPDTKHGVPQAAGGYGKSVECGICGPQYADAQGGVRLDGLHKVGQTACGFGQKHRDLDGRTWKDRDFQGVVLEPFHDFRQEEPVMGRQFLQVRG